MTKLLTMFLALTFATAAVAQQAPAKVTLEFTQDKLSVLAQGLEALPYKISAPLIDDIRRQIQAQQPAPTVPAAQGSPN